MTEKKQRKDHPKTQGGRNADIYHRVTELGHSCVAVGEDCGLTKARVSQIVKAYGKRLQKKQEQDAKAAASADAVYLAAHRAAGLD